MRGQAHSLIFITAAVWIVSSMMVINSVHSRIPPIVFTSPAEVIEDHLRQMQEEALQTPSRLIAVNDASASSRQELDSSHQNEQIGHPQNPAHPLPSRCTQLIPRFQAILGSSSSADYVLHKESQLAQYSQDEGHFQPHLPSVVVRPSSSEEVSSILALCNEHYIPVVPYGTGTGLEGGVVPLHNGLTLDTSRLIGNANGSAVTELNEEDFNVRVGAGVTRKQLNAALRDTGLQFTVDPGADASIGGMVATGASGTTSVRYGTMRENVVNLEVVLADGTILHTKGEGRRPWKSSAGYDLTPLFVGSEGTLGVVVSAWVRLHPVSPHISVAVCAFATIGEAIQAVVDIRRAAIPLARLEFLDTEQMRAVNNYQASLLPQKNSSGGGMIYAEKPTLFLEVNASSMREVEDQLVALRDICATALKFDSALEPEGITKLWFARHNAYYATLGMRKGARGFCTDVCVPISKLSKVLESARRILDEAGLYATIVGHAGEGNFHCIVPVYEEDAGEMARVWAASDAIVHSALEAGGTCTGEHGVGQGKRRYLEKEFGPAGLALMRQVKATLDPRGIMNPGKVL